MKAFRSLPILSALLIAATIALSVRLASAEPAWDQWGPWAAAGSVGTCHTTTFSSGGVPGHSVLNGNDSGQVIAYCNNNGAYDCGHMPTTSIESIVRAYACPTLGTSGCEFTGNSTGTSVGSQAGGRAHTRHRCQKGFDL